MSSIAMSNETDLDWLAQNVHKWPAGDHQPWCYVYWKGGQRAVSGNCITVIQPCARVEMSDWVARRAELQNKPSWGAVPSHANWLAQDAAGSWLWHSSEPECRNGGWIGSTTRGYAAKGCVIGDWRYTLEKRPKEFKPFTSIEDNHEKEMKQDNGWFERGDLPPVGGRCVLHAAENNGEEVMFIGVTSDSCPVFETAQKRVFVERGEYKFTPIRTERDELIEIIASNLSGTTGKVADAIIAAGFKLEAK